MSDTFKSGYVGIIGRSNVGKSTLLNYFIQNNISSISKRPQTTWKKILGIVTEEDSQIIFVDTPGIFKPKGALQKKIQQNTLSFISEVDLFLFVSQPNLDSVTFQKDKEIIEMIKDCGKPAFLLLNKRDQFTSEQVFKSIERFNQIHPFHETFVVSALKHVGLEKICPKIVQNLPLGHKYFEDNDITNLNENEIIVEIIREQLFLNYGDELPYDVFVQMTDRKKQGDVIHYMLQLLVQKNSQKKIIIGKDGMMIKKIITFAQNKAQKLLEKNVQLHLNFKITKNWSKDVKYLNLIDQ